MSDDPLSLEASLSSLDASMRAQGGARHAVFRVRAVTATAGLVQACSADLALLAADNFARAAAATGVDRIVCLSSGTASDLPREAQGEIERVLASRGVPVTTSNDDSRDEAFAIDPRDARRTVISIQRMTLPIARDVAWAAQEYPRWCARTLAPFLRVGVDTGGTVRFHMAGVDVLVLAPDAARCDQQRFLYTIAGGTLARPDQAGTFEFREIGDDRTLLTIVRDFEPSLPWWIYRSTEALAHRWIMNAFGRAIATSARSVVRPR